MTREYKQAKETVEAASSVYSQAKSAYYAGSIDDATFIVARAAYKQAEKAFDIAFNLEAARDSDEPAVIEGGK